MGIFGRKPNIKKLEANRDINGLIEALKHKDTGVRRNAVGALGRLGDTTAVEPLLEVLNDEDFYVRGDAAKALGEIGDERAVKPLERLAESEYFGIGKGSNLEDMLRQASTMKRQTEYLKNAAKEALDKIKTKRS